MGWMLVAGAEIKNTQGLFLWATDASVVLCLQRHDLAIDCFGRVSKSFLESVRFMCGLFTITPTVRQEVEVAYLTTYVSSIMFG